MKKIKNISKNSFNFAFAFFHSGEAKKLEKEICDKITKNYPKSFKIIEDKKKREYKKCHK